MVLQANSRKVGRLAEYLDSVNRIKNTVNIYVNKERWEKSNHYEVNTALPFYQWAKIWGSEERGMNLCLGNGLYSDDPDNQIWFVAHNKKPSN